MMENGSDSTYCLPLKINDSISNGRVLGDLRFPNLSQDVRSYKSILTHPT
jgi:hypothetical protein